MSRRNGPNIVTNGLVLYLDAANRQSYVSGSTVWNDVSNNGNTGTLTNGPTFNSGSGGSIVFDGIDDYVVETQVDLSSTNAVSMEMWVKLLSYPQTPGSWKSISELSTNFNNVITGFTVSYADDSAGFFSGTYPIAISLKGNSGYNISGFDKTLVNDLNWHHWVCIFDKSITGSSPQETFLYIDGIYRNPTINPGSTYRQDNTNNFGNLPLYFAARAGTISNSNVQLSQYKIYNRALSASEILQNYNATKARFGL